MKEHERLDLYKEMYFAEEATRESIQSRLQFVLALIVPVLGGAGFLLEKSHSAPSAQVAADGVILVACGLVAISATISIYFFVRSAWGHAYQAIPHASRMEAYHKQIWDTYHEFEEQEQLTDYYFKAFVGNTFAEAANFNTTVNEFRAEQIHRCLTFLVVALVPLLVAFFVYLYADYGIEQTRFAQPTQPEDVRSRNEPEEATAPSASSATSSQIHPEGQAAGAATAATPAQEVVVNVGDGNE